MADDGVIVVYRGPIINQTGSSISGTAAAARWRAAGRAAGRPGTSQSRSSPLGASHRTTHSISSRIIGFFTRWLSDLIGDKDILTFEPFFFLV